MHTSDLEYRKLSNSKLFPLPCGKITATGWIREQLERNKDGMGGHLDELEPNMIKYPYTSRKTHSGWGDVQAGWGAEISGNYWYGLIGLAFTLDDEELKAKAEDWVNNTLLMQDSDGYMGTYTENDDKYDDYNAWGTTCGMRAMLLYYEATQREDVFNAVYRCMLWFCDNWTDNRKTRYAGSFIVEPMINCYLHTGDKHLLEFCKYYENFLCENDLFLNSKNAFADPKLYYNSNHSSAYSCLIRRPALLYSVNLDNEYLQASIYGIDKFRNKAVHSTGAPVCNNEYLGPVSSAAESEYCSFTFLNASYAVIGAVTGNSRYGDYMEELVYNAAEGARKKDEKAIAYNTSPNQIYATVNSSNYCDQHQLYAPIHPVSCCAVNSVAVIPDLVKNMAFTDRDENLYINIYGPCEINHNGAIINAETLYPFKNKILYKFTTEKDIRFTFNLKKPYWCEKFSLKINGEEYIDRTLVNGYIPIGRLWHNGDTAEISFEIKPVVKRIDDSDSGMKYPLTIKYGVLVFSLPIEENWSDAGVKGAHTPLPEGWAWYSVTPVIHDGNHDKYEKWGYRKYNITWNVALDEKNAAKSIKIIENKKEGYVWENPPLRIEIDGYKAPFSYAPYPSKTQEIYESELYVTDKLRLTLVPYGCTALRITYFPRADESCIKKYDKT